MESNVIEWGIPKYPNFTLYSNRIDSFVTNDWPPGLRQKPHELAKAGMFYTGRSDLTICYFCGGGIHMWLPEDSAWIEHIKHFPSCGYLKLFRSNINIYHANNSIEKQETNELCLIFKNKFKTLIEFILKCFKKDKQKDNVSQHLQYDVICKLCVERKADIIFLPCAHILTCKDCASTLNNCPICRFDINQLVKVYFA